MAEEYKVLGQSYPALTTLTDVYTVPAGKSAVISTITLCNRNSSALNMRLAVSPAGATIEDKHYLSYGLPLQAGDTLSMTIGVTLAATDVLRVYTNAVGLSVNVFGTEIT